MPRFTDFTSSTISRAFASNRLKALLGPVARSGESGEGTPELSRRLRSLEEGLHDARRTSQKRAKRISALKSRVGELETGRDEDKRMLHYLLADAFERRGPWVTGARIAGENYGRQPRNHSPRLEEFFETFPEASTGRVLEPGSLEGSMTVGLAKRAREVVGLEARPESVERAVFLKGLFGAENVDFRVADLEEEDLAAHGEFDAVFCCGLLYHLPHPRAFVQSVAEISPNLYLDTQYARPEWELSERDGLRGWMREEEPEDPQSGLYETAFWPTLDDLYRLLSESGYECIETLDFLPDNRHGPRVHIAASRP